MSSTCAVFRVRASLEVRLVFDAQWLFIPSSRTQVREVNGMGLEVCCTLGMLNGEQARQLKAAGLTAYNHNLDTSREFYPSVITTR